MSTYRIYGITNYGTGSDTYTLIASGTGSVDASFDVSGYSGFAIETGNKMAFNKILLDGKALYTDVNNALHGSNLDMTPIEFEGQTFPKIFQAKDNLYLTDNDMTNMDVELGAVLTFTTRSASSLSVALDAFDFSGTAGDDAILGNELDNDITPDAGSDIIDGASGNDRVIYSGNKADYSIAISLDDGTHTITDLSAEGQVDTLSNIEQIVFDDQVIGLAVPLAPTKAGGTVYVGSELSDWIVSGAGNDKITAGNGNNAIRAGDGNNSVIAGSGNDWIKAGNGNQKINAGDGNNRIEITSSGSSQIISGSGDDEINTASGNYKINAGEGNNEVLIHGPGSGKANTVVTGAGDDFVHIEGSSADKINVGDGNNEVAVGANDTIISGSGDDRIYGGKTVNAGNGDNEVDLWFSDPLKYKVQCGTGADDISVMNGLGGEIKSGAGADKVSCTWGKNKIDLGADLNHDYLYLEYALSEGKAVFNTVSNFNVDDVVEICPGEDGNPFDGAIIQSGAKLKPDNSGANIYFDTTGGKLYYDADGAGSGAAVQLAVFKGTGLADAEISLHDAHLYISSGVLSG